MFHYLRVDVLGFISRLNEATTFLEKPAQKSIFRLGNELVEMQKLHAFEQSRSMVRLCLEKPDGSSFVIGVKKKVHPDHAIVLDDRSASTYELAMGDHVLDVHIPYEQPLFGAERPIQQMGSNWHRAT